MHVLPADIYTLACSSLALSLCIFATEYHDSLGHATFFVGTTVSSISIILHSIMLLCDYVSEEDLEKHPNSLAASLSFIFVTWTMVYLWTFALAAATMAHFSGVSEMACGSHCRLNVQATEFILILCEIVNSLSIVIRSVQERKAIQYRESSPKGEKKLYLDLICTGFMHFQLPCHRYELIDMTQNTIA